MKIHLNISVLLVLVFYSLSMFAQSVVLEVGVSKHFIPNAENYEQPNLDIQIRHRISEKFEYLLTYSNVSTFNSYPDHEILPWNGDQSELYTRHMNAIDLSWNLLPLLIQNEMFGLAVGVSGRLRDEVGFTQCQYAPGGWMECFMYREKYTDIGLNIQSYFNYFFWKRLGICASVNERFYTAGPTAFSINLGAIYKFEF